MPALDFDVSKTEDGRILIMTETFAASFVNGTWHKKMMFKADDVRDAFETVENAAEAKKIYDQAAKALNL